MTGLRKVMHVMARLAPAGTERQLIGMLQAAHGTLWDAHLVVLYHGFPLADELARTMPVTQLPYSTGYDPRRPGALRGLVSSSGAEVVHSSLWGANVVTRTSLAGPGRPAVVVSERRVEDFRKPWTRVLDRALQPVTDHYIGNSLDVVGFIGRAHGVPRDRISLIRNGIDGTVFHPATSPRLPRAGIRVGGVGRLVPEKGFDTAVAALPAILARHPGSELLIAGQGPERAALERAAEGLPVRLVGQLSTPADVASFMRDLDVFVLPSHFEGLPNVVLEALACGIPVVATDVPGMAEAAGGRATLVPPGDPVALAAAIVAAAGRVTERPAAGQVQSFTDVAEQHLAVFETALTRRRRTGQQQGANR